MHIHNASKQYKNKYSECLLLQESYRDEYNIPRHRTILNLSKLPRSLTRVIIDAVKGKVLVDINQITQTDNRSLGEVTVFYRLAQRVGLVRILGEQLGKHIASLTLAMVINRVSLPKSRYALSEWLPTTFLPEILHTSLTHFHHNKLYEALVILTQHQRRIEDELFVKTREKENGLRLMLYDITSTYLEGEQCELAAYGYSRDKQSGKKQLIIGLVATPSGRPVTVEVLTGNTADKTTLLAKIEELRQRFNLTEVIYVFDRGMKDEQKLSLLRSNHFTYITALTRTEVETLAKAGVIQLGLFDEELAEYHQGERRYVICRSDQWERNRVRRENLLTKTEGELQKLKERVTQGKLKDPSQRLPED